MKKIVFGLMMVVVVFFSDCKKRYPEDTWEPHFRSASKRLTKGEWHVQGWKKLVPFSFSPFEVPDERISFY